MPSRATRFDEHLRRQAPYVLPLLIGGWAVAVSWGTPQASAKVVVVGAMAALLTQGSRWPLVCLVAAFGALFGVGSLDAPRPEDALLAMVVCACYLVGRHARLRHQPWAAVSVLVLLSTNLAEPGRDVVTADVVFPVLFTAAPWLLGLTVQLAARRELEAMRFAGELDESRAAEVSRATTEERLRIAREFHDVVAHDISGLSLQAQVLRRRAESGGEVTQQDLREIEVLAQQAMTDVRRLLGVLRPPDQVGPRGPSDTLDLLPDLIAGAGRLGQAVELRTTGTARDLPPALSAAAYRILQEALTNARRHSVGTATAVELDWRDAELVMRVRNPVAPDQTPKVGGHGVPGIHERVGLFGGRSVVGVVEGEWLVEVHLPAPVVVAGLPS